jgi:hypothetical protein
MVGGRENFAFFDAGGKSTDWSDIVVLIDVLQIVGVRFQWKPDEMQFFDKMSQNLGWRFCLFVFVKTKASVPHFSVYWRFLPSGEHLVNFSNPRRPQIALKSTPKTHGPVLLFSVIIELP